METFQVSVMHVKFNLHEFPLLCVIMEHPVLASRHSLCVTQNEMYDGGF